MWKSTLWQELEAVDTSLRAMAPSPQKATLLRSMLDRVEEVKAAAEQATRDRYAVAVSSSAARSSAIIAAGEETGDSGGSVLAVTPADECKQNSNTAPSDDFLAWIQRKKEKAAALKKNKKK